MIKLLKFGGFGLLCTVASMLFGMQGAYSQSQTFYFQDYTGFGTGVAVCGRTAAVGAPYFEEWNPDTPPPEWNLLWLGVVNVYTSNADRTRWTLLTVLHADDALPENQEFGKAIAMYGNRLVIASNAALRIYERRLGDYELLDTVVFSDAISRIQFEKDVLAVGVGSSVRVFRVNLYGKARQVASLSQGGAMSLNANADTLAVVGTGGSVNLYQPHGPTWVLTAIVTAPSSTALGFGSGVALSASGNRLIVGSPYEDEQFLHEENSILNRGAVYVYLRANDRWVLVQRLASNVPGQPSYAHVGFGQEVLMSGSHVWITAPHGNELFASSMDIGRSLLYRWNAGRLEFVAHGPRSWPEGGIDMTSRYVMEGDILNSQLFHQEGAHIIDLGPVVPISAGTANDAASSSPEDED